MNGQSLGAAIRRLRESLGGPAGSDAALLDRFALDRDPAAFAGLVARYGPMVLGLCRRIVGDPHRAEDVFQAVFLILARKAASIRKRDAVGSWLYGVAYRLARKASRERKRPEFLTSRTPVAYASGSPDPAATAAWNDLLTALDQELHRLPDRLRAPLLLCYYDGCTQDEAARRLGWSFGTFRRRLDQARELLRVRMTARGATLGAGLLATVFATGGARVLVPAILSRTTIDAAVTFAAGGQLAGAAAHLAEEGLRMAVMSKVRAGVALAVLVGGLGTGAIFGLRADRPEDKSKPPVAHAPGSPEATAPGAVVLRHGGAPFRHGSEIINVLVTPDGKTILTQGARSVRLWDATTGQDQGVLELPDDGPEFWTASLTPDGKTLLTTRHNGTGQVWDLAARKMTRSFRLADPPFDVAGAKCVHSPDGKEIAVVTSDGSIRVCDVTTGKEMEQLRSHSDDVSAAAFSPDGKQLVLARGPRDNTWLVWDVDTGTPDKTRTWNLWQRNVKNLIVSADSKWMAAAYALPPKPDKLAETGIEVYEWNSPNRNKSLGGSSLADVLMAITPDGKYLLAPDRRSQGYILTQWDLRTGRAMRQYPGQDNPIGALAFTSDGKSLITADGGLRFWDWTTGTERRSSSDGKHCYALTADGKAVVEGSSTGVIRMWDAITGKELRRFDVPRPTPELQTIVANVATSPDGKNLAAQGWVARDRMTGGDGWYIWVWDLAGNKLSHRLTDRPSIQMPGNAVAFGPDSQTLYSTSGGLPLMGWDLATGKEVEPPIGEPAPGFGGRRGRNPRGVAGNVTLPGGRGRPAQEVILTPDGKQLITWDGSSQISVQNLNPQSEIGNITLAAGIGQIRPRLVFAGDSSRLAVSVTTNHGGSPGVQVFDIATCNAIQQFQNLPRPPGQLALSTNGAMLAVAPDTEDPSIDVFDVGSGREVKRFTGLHGRAAWLAFAPNGKRLYAASTDTTTLAWELP